HHRGVRGDPAVAPARGGPPRNRTGTPRRAADFESAASANSARGPLCPPRIAPRGQPDHRPEGADATSLRSIAGENWDGEEEFHPSSDAMRYRTPVFPASCRLVDTRHGACSFSRPKPAGLAPPNTRSPP